MTRHRPSLYEATGQTMLRAAAHTSEPAMPPWPTSTAPAEEWRAWLSTVWSDADFRQTVSQASPILAQQVQAIIDVRTPKVRRMRRAALATARYVIRYAHRSTPYGLFAGVAPLAFDQATAVRIGDEHQAVARPEPALLDEMLSTWESDARRMADTEVCVNTLIQQRDRHINVPSEGDAAFRLSLSPALRLVLDLARSPIAYRQLSEKLAAEFPAVDGTARDRLLGELLRVRLLRSSLRAPATVADPTDVLPPAARAQAAGLRAACDLRLDADVRLSEQVLTEAETAATVLARLVTHPNGTPTWRRWIEQFSERYGENTAVPVEVATDPDRGVGFPAGFVTASEPPRPMSRRDRLLLELAGTAAAEGSRTVAVTGALIEELEAAAGGKPRYAAPHLELAAQVHATSGPALDRGDFRLRVLTVSRSAGSMTGRFWHLFPGTESAYAFLPTVDPEAELVQLSFHAGRVAADLLTRAPQALPRIVSIGEFRHPAPHVLFPRDLAVTVADGRPQLVESATGKPLELLAPTAINFLWNNYTPPMARFLGEISRAASPQVTWFDWGAAWTLPFTPALTYRRTILTTARWKLRSRTLPDRTAPLQQWADQLHAWRARFRVPEQVLLAEDDQQLPLDLARDIDLDLLRAHLDASPFGIATLHDAPPPDADGWIGGRAHSIVVPPGQALMTATTVPRTQDLSEGALGMALLDIERRDLSTARRHLTQATAHGVSTGGNASLFHGAPALEFVLARAHGADDNVRAAVDRVVDARLAAAHRRQAAGALPHLAEWDLIRGLTGLAALLLSRQPPAPRLPDVLTCLVALAHPAHGDGRTVPGWWSPVGPNGKEMAGGHGNNGMAHGIAGPLAVLSLALRDGINVPGQEEAVDTFATWLDRYGAHYWSTAAHLDADQPPAPESTRQSWCYGQPGIARAQQLAALALGDPARRRAAEDTIETTLTDPLHLARITDSTLCHGWAGLLTLTRAVAAGSPAPDRFSPIIQDLHQRLATSWKRLPKLGSMEGRAGAQLALQARCHRLEPRPPAHLIPEPADV